MLRIIRIKILHADYTRKETGLLSGSFRVDEDLKTIRICYFRFSSAALVVIQCTFEASVNILVNA